VCVCTTKVEGLNRFVEKIIFVCHVIYQNRCSSSFGPYSRKCGITHIHTHTTYALIVRGDTVRTLKAVVTEGQEVRRLDEGSAGDHVLGDQHVEYTIRVKKTAEWTVKRRFRDFEEFRHRMKLYLASKYKDRTFRVPKLPQKRGVFQKLVRTQCKEDFVRNRGKGLSTFLEALLSQREFVACPDFGDFLTKPTAGHVASRGEEVYKIHEPKDESSFHPPSEGSEWKREGSVSSSQSMDSFGAGNEMLKVDGGDADATRSGSQHSHTTSVDSSASSCPSVVDGNIDGVDVAPHDVGEVAASAGLNRAKTLGGGGVESRGATKTNATGEAGGKNTSTLPSASPIEMLPSRRRMLDDLIRKLSIRQRAKYCYDDFDDVKDSISEGLLIVWFPETKSEVVGQVVESSNFQDRIEYRCNAVLNGHRSVLVGYVSKSTLEGEANISVMKE